MAEIKIDDTALINVRDKVVVVTGCAQGIGAETVHQLFQAGAHLVAADLNDIKGQSVIDKLKQDAQGQRLDATYVHVDVSSYDSVHALFKHALDLHGRVDMAIHCAAITEVGGWFAPGADLDSITSPPTTKVLEVNLFGTLYFTHVALAAMRPGSNAQLSDDKSITLISSVAGFKDSPGLFAYSASKHGVMGLMRSLRGYLPSTFNVRINVVCPWATDTEMISGVRDIWFQNSLPVNSPGEVARIILQCNGDKNIHGKAIYVAGGKGFDIEEGINRTEPDWLGEKQAIDLEKGQQVLGTGSGWTDKQT
ncbi:short-chain dehydrogenase/reductase SDR [Ilyonectria sp. MPI-CAGE-AT-0026]|nr:short-chain dehydrogenase/reductase SDR [Ilyonectria sp. MPI-CAGE-AT-0026]